jgi:hypothetical protein
MVYSVQREKISGMLRSRPEVQTAMRALLDTHLNSLPLDKVGAIFSFIVKAAYPLPDEDLKKIIMSVKRNIVMQTTDVDTASKGALDEKGARLVLKKNREALTVQAIFLKCGQKLLYDKVISSNP